MDLIKSILFITMFLENRWQHHSKLFIDDQNKILTLIIFNLSRKKTLSKVTFLIYHKNVLKLLLYMHILNKLSRKKRLLKKFHLLLIETRWQQYIKQQNRCF